MRGIYAGIGSRETPSHILDAIFDIGRWMVPKGYTLRSGGARGADKAFEAGCDSRSGPKEIFTSKDSNPAWEEHASWFHPAWGACSPYARQLHARNSAIILGADLISPVDFVICWTQAGLEGGGTGQGLRIARHHHIPIFNLFEEDAETRLLNWMEENPLAKT